MTIHSDFFPLTMVMFHSYVKLPEGKDNNEHLQQIDQTFIRVPPDLSHDD